MSGGFKRNVNPEYKFVEMDVRDRKIHKLIKGVEVICHLAAYAAEGQSFFSPIEVNDINITSMNNLLVAAVNNNVEKFIFTSSMAVYGDQEPPFNEDMWRKPVDLMAAQKLTVSGPGGACQARRSGKRRRVVRMGVSTPGERGR
jgi:UDP-glucose 4-epimerase